MGTGGGEDMRKTHASRGNESHPLQIARLIDLERGGADGTALTGGVDKIFFETAGRSFATATEQAAFRELWLGQYLGHDRDCFWLALRGAEVIGYLAGSMTDPAASPRFASLGYFASIAGPCARFPAHLHIPLTASARGRGTGARLVDAFCRQAHERGALGVHVVTAASARNVGFYHRAGFRDEARCDWNGRQLLMLVRRI
jgi:GNAT superfamily N-acetyltransferase